MKKYLPFCIGLLVCIAETTFGQLKINNASNQKIKMSLPVVHITPVSIKQVHVPEMKKPLVVSVNNVQEWAAKMRAQCPLSKSPVPTLTLKAERTNNFNADLQWETKNAFKAKEFNIERSLGDTAHFVSINLALASAGSGVKKEYQLPDRNDYSGISFYRIKQLNRDTSYLYSNIVLVNGYDSQLFIIYPNPVTSGKIWIEATAKSRGNALIILYDPLGKIIEQQFVTCEKNGAIQKTFEVSHFASGVYQVKILMPDKTSLAGKFIKE